MASKRTPKNNKNTPPAANTKEKIMQHEKTLRPLFNNFITTRKAAELTGIDRKAVMKHFREFSEQILNQRDEMGYTLDEQQQIAKDQALGLLSTIIIDMQNLRSKIQEYENLYDASARDALSKGKLQLPNMVYFLVNKKLEVNQFLSEIIEITHKVKTMPTIDEQAAYMIPGLKEKSDGLLESSNPTEQ